MSFINRRIKFTTGTRQGKRNDYMISVCLLRLPGRGDGLLELVIIREQKNARRFEIQASDRAEARDTSEIQEKTR